MIDNPYRHLSRHAILTISIISIGLACPSRVSAQDPVWDFIIAADSIYKDAGEEALAGFVGEHSILVGAAVNQLIDVAVTVGDQGDAAGEKENLDFALLIGRIYAGAGGPAAPMDLAGVYTGWSPEQRALRAEGKKLEENAKTLRGEQDFAGAEKALLDAIDIYTKIGDGYSEAVCWGSLGVVAWYAGDFDLVLEYYGKALEKRRAIDDAILEGRTLNGLGTANMILEDFEAASGWYSGAIDLRRRTGDLPGLVTSLTYLGNVYVRTGRIVEAKDSYEAALGLLDESWDPKQRVELLISIGSLYSDMARHRMSSEAYEEALDIAVANGDANTEVVCRLNISLNLIDSSRFSEAMAQLDKAGALLGQVSEKRLELDLIRNRFLLYLETGEMDRARDDLLAFLGKAKEFEAPGYEMEGLIKLGYLYLELDSPGRALSSAGSALELAESAGDRTMMRESHVLAAQVERMSGNLENSLEHWRKALRIDSIAGSETGMIEDRTGIANVLAVQGMSEEARRLYHELETLGEDSGDSSLMITISLGLGHTWEKDDPDRAMEYYRSALDMTEGSRIEAGGSASGSGFFSGSRRYYYEEVARFCAGEAWRTGDDDWSAEAFMTIERAKARGLLDLLERSVASETSEGEEAVLDSIYSLDDSAPDYGSRLERLEREYERLRNERIAKRTGNMSGGTSLAGLDDIRKKLPRGTVMLAYAMGDSISLLWALDRKGCDLYELPDRRELRSQVMMFRDAMTRPQSGDRALAAASTGLYRTLVEPASKHIGNAKQILVIPDGCLFEIPFEALLKDEPGPEGWSGAPFLARSATVFYAPSASVYLSVAKGKKKKHGLDMIAAGDPDYSLFAEGGEELRALPFTKDEVDGIGGNFEESRRVVLSGEGASEAALKDAIRDPGAEMIHIAAHGLVRPAEPAASCIALCPDEEGREDGLLHTLEILALPVDSRLVVLSACESARGRIGRGEGVIGLSRAFLAAGASNVVASQWAVPDESTSLLMREYYIQMVKKKKPAHEALNRARISLMESGEYSHPFYWSPFVLVGAGK